MAIAYAQAPVQISLIVDGRTLSMSTRAGTVADLLVEAGLPIWPGDAVVPPPWTRLGPGSTVTVRRGQPVRVKVDGQVLQVRSHGRSTEDVLAAAGVALRQRDRLIVNQRPWPHQKDNGSSGLGLVASLGPMSVGTGPAQSEAELVQAQPEGAEPGRVESDSLGTQQPVPWTIDVLRAVPVTVADRGLEYATALAGSTVAEALIAAGTTLYPEDVVTPGRDERLVAGMRIDIHRATPFTLDLDGRLVPARALAASVGEALDKAGFTLRGRDYAIPEAGAPLSPHMHVQLVRVVEDILVEQVAIPFRTETVAEPGMDLDETRVERAGQPGQKTQRIRIVYENGEVVERTVEEESIDREPVSQIVAYGTRIVWRTVETEAGPRQYWRKLRVYATSYSLSRSGTSPSAPWYGRTRLGLPMRKGIVAVDPRLIPLGTNLFVPEYGIGLAGDTGGGVRNYHIDLGYDDDNYVSWHWRVDVYLLEPLPPEHQMRWILP